MSDPVSEIPAGAGEAHRHRRGGGRSANTRGRGAAIKQLPWTLPVNTDRPTEPIGEEGVAAIHDGAMRILEEIGIEMLNDEAIGYLKKAGATVDGQNVRMGRDMRHGARAQGAEPIHTDAAQS